MQFKIKKFKEKNNLLKIFIIAIIIIFAINIGIITASKKTVKQKVDAALETKRPANISIEIIKDSTCADCADINPILNAVRGTNIKIAKEETFEAASPEAKNLINELEIKKLPTFIIKGEINKNEDVAKLLSRIGEIKSGIFKFNYMVGPYTDLASNTVKGRAFLTFINDKSCKECYDASPFKQILANNFGMFNPATVSLDKSEKAAGDLIRKYKIEAAPMFILTGEVSEYPRLIGAWFQIGTVEKDSAYVLRNIKNINPNLIYRDLKTGKIIKPEAAQAPLASPVPTGSPEAK